ncbi:MAG: HdeD family acid-resistance protein [Saprospiraceae bacterium]|nr:HdeD family acid-resistance protein [Saprospiraceae bacterium]MCB0575689.1 HdeD family acid-resistance protein [Saprospiraceae bacterium]MCB9306492.1 HdeD family acid-resistance protein [Lewinellaceae bacterium]MCB9355476.1 HdeD family acid-resistance protein [Lewinellaceae bacterium]
MLSRLTRFWWVLVFRGLISILFAVFAFLNPALAFDALILILGIFLVADGATAVFLGARMRGHDDDWWVTLIEGALGMGLGIVALVNPELTAAGLVLVLAVWLLVTGVFEIGTAIKLRKEIDNEWLLGLAGVVSIALGILMIINPTFGEISIMLWIGIYALLFGLLLVGLGWKIRKLHQRLEE